MFPIWNNEQDKGPIGPIGPTGPTGPTGATGAISKYGGWHKNSNQTITTTGAPSFVGLTWQQSSYGDTTTISHTAPNSSSFTVNQSGIYSISLSTQYANLNTATLTDTTFRLAMACNRGGNSGTILTVTFDFPNNLPTNPTQQLNGVYELRAGDIISFQTIQYLSAGSFTINGQSVAPLDFDYNSFWSWTQLAVLP
jgi:hypothetical protein